MPTTEQVVSGSVEAAVKFSRARAAERNTNDLRQKQKGSDIHVSGWQWLGRCKFPTIGVAQRQPIVILHSGVQRKRTQYRTEDQACSRCSPLELPFSAHGQNE